MYTIAWYSLIYNYCILSWGSSVARTALLPLHTIQKKVIVNDHSKSLYSYKAHAGPLFKYLKILTIYDVHKLEVAKYTCY